MNLIYLLVAVLLVAQPLSAQTATLRGQVMDPSGALVPGAEITLTGPAGVTKTATSTNDGSFSVGDLPPGSYTIQVSAPGLAMRQPVKISLTAGAQALNLLLDVAAMKQQVAVEENAGPAVSTDAQNNASAIVLTGSDLDALSDNAADLVADLQALAGPSAGPNGGAIFIDGFSGGELPPKNAIREIRINQNPFSPEYDRLGFGRIDIFTKPGTDKFRGDIGYNFANEKWNSRNAYAGEKAPFRLNEIRSTLSGPINKRASFDLNLVREWVDNGNVINGVRLDPEALVAQPFNGFAVSALRRTGFTPRFDYQLSTNHTLTVRYSYNRDIVRNAGTGSLNLDSRGFHNDAVSQTVQITETAVLSTRAINEARFQYLRPTTVSQANASGYALQVLGAFNGGGNPLGRSTNAQSGYEFQNYTSVLHGTHTWRFGVRFRGMSETSMSPQNYHGTFTFSGGLAPELTGDNQSRLDGTGQPVLVNISSLESYRRTLLFQQLGFPAAQIRQLGGGASQFSINSGNPFIAGSQFDLGLFVGDEWKVRQNLTVNLGLRYETQTNIHHRRDFAPRIGLAWAPGGSAKTRPRSVVRVGFGMFYDRFSLGNTLTAQRYNGVIQQQYVIANPDFFPSVPTIASLPGPIPPSTIQQVGAGLRAPYLIQSAAGFERQLPFNTTVAITYANTHGVHQLRSRDINAPLPGTYSRSVRGSGEFPFGRPGLVVQMESTGLYNQNQMIVNVNTKMNRNVSLIGSYVYNRALSNTDGLATFPANPYSMAGEYGPASTDIHHRVSLAGTVTSLWGIRLNPLLTANTGPPFDITAGQDFYGNTLFTARPGIATDPNKPGLLPTSYGLLDPSPAPGQSVLSRNFGRGPGQIMLNMRISRTFDIGPKGEGRGSASGGPAGPPGGGPGGNRRGPESPFGLGTSGSQGGGSASAGRRYALTVSMSIRNLTNHNNPGPIIGNITSPLFGRANQPAGSGGGIFSENANNRKLELQMRLTF